MLEQVWLILPVADADNDEWQPRSVFETWEQAVARLKAENEGQELEITGGLDAVVVMVGDNAPINIVAVPIEYKD